MSARPHITTAHRQYILANRYRFKQTQIAAHLGITPAVVCKILKGPKPVAKVKDGMFDIDEYKKLVAI